MSVGRRYSSSRSSIQSEISGSIVERRQKRKTREARWSTVTGKLWSLTNVWMIPQVLATSSSKIPRDKGNIRWITVSPDDWFRAWMCDQVGNQVGGKCGYDLREGLCEWTACRMLRAKFNASMRLDLNYYFVLLFISDPDPMPPYFFLLKSHDSLPLDTMPIWLCPMRCLSFNRTTNLLVYGVEIFGELLLSLMFFSSRRAQLRPIEGARKLEISLVENGCGRCSGNITS